MFLVSSFIGFCVYYTAKKVEKANIDFKKNRDIVFFIRTMKNFSEDFFYYLGLYLFHKYPHKVQEEQEAMEELCVKETEQRKLIKKLKHHDKDMLQFVIISISSFVLMRIFGTVVYCALDEGNTIRQPMYILVPIYKLFLLSFLIYSVFVAGLQRLRLKMYVETLKNENLFYQKKNILKKYLKGALSGLRQFLATGSPLKIMKNVFYFNSKALFVLEIFNFFSRLFWSCSKMA